MCGRYLLWLLCLFRAALLLLLQCGNSYSGNQVTKMRVPDTILYQGLNFVLKRKSYDKAPGRPWHNPECKISSNRKKMYRWRRTNKQKSCQRNKVEFVKVCQNLDKRVDIFCMSGYKHRDFFFSVHFMRDFKLQYCRRWKICIRCSCNIRTFSHAYPKEQTIH